MEPTFDPVGFCFVTLYRVAILFHIHFGVLLHLILGVCTHFDFEMCTKGTH